jgi:hypothetical protein
LLIHVFEVKAEKLISEEPCFPVEALSAIVGSVPIIRNKACHLQEIRYLILGILVIVFLVILKIPLD